MATLLTDNTTVGLYPLPQSASRVVPIPAGQYEFAPLLPISLDPDEIGNGENYIGTYQGFGLTVQAIPNLPEEVITGFTLRMTSCVLEEPLPGADTTHSLKDELKIPVTPYWSPPLFFEPLVSVLNFTQSGTISGYFTERNFYDREWVVSYFNAVARFTSNGLFYAPLENFPKNLPFDIKNINIPLPSSVNINTFYPFSISNAYTYDAEVLQSYFPVSQVISYKPSEIKKLRFYFEGSIFSNKGVFPFTAHMTVQQNQKAANERLRYALNRRKSNAMLPI